VAGVLLGLLAAVLILPGPVSGAEVQPGPGAEGSAESRKIVVTIVCDNYPDDERLKTAWGFACVIEGLDRTILFDSGGDGELLLSNMAKAGFQPDEIHRVVLSHFHNDHTGGLEALLKANNNVKVFVPHTFPAEFKQRARELGAEVVEAKEPREVCPGAWTTGVLTDPLPEHGLYLKTTGGLVVITGCAHPGIAHFAATAKEHAQTPVRFVLGGFHMGRASADQIDQVIRELRQSGVRQVAPTHCSGNQTRRRMQEVLGDQYVPSGLGTRFFLDREKENEKTVARDGP
jgi:7,8-dihydropterin-6-yl-methyl-4-(beta-D-ribofuranosyl)aminobenzene 5'-phosphate synthase